MRSTTFKNIRSAISVYSLDPEYILRKTQWKLIHLLGNQTTLTSHCLLFTRDSSPQCTVEDAEEGVDVRLSEGLRAVMGGNMTRVFRAVTA